MIMSQSNEKYSWGEIYSKESRIKKIRVSMPFCTKQLGKYVSFM